MKYTVGDKVRIKDIDWYYDNRDRIDEVTCGNTNFIPDMVKYCEEIVTISAVLPTLKVYHIKEDGGMFNWTDEMIEGLAEKESDLIPKFGEYSDNEPLDVPTITTEFAKEHGLPCPNGYIFKDENGNVINATKIVLEKKKKECPKTYEECENILGLENSIIEGCLGYEYKLLNAFQKLLMCRDAYWKIAGEEMGLGKPWKPDWKKQDKKYIISVFGDNVIYFENETYNHNTILAFPTEEMRDIFYEYFKSEIEICKEFL